MRIRIKRMFTSIRTSFKRLFLWKKRQQEVLESFPCKLFLTCDQLTLDRFIHCFKGGDLSVLVIEGNADLNTLSSVWNDIYLEFVDLMSTGETEYVMDLRRRINIASIEIEEIESILFCLSFKPYPKLIDKLKDHGYYNEFNIANPEEYMESLKAVEQSLGSKRFQLEQDIKELKGYVEQQMNKEMDMDFFDFMVIRLSKYFGFMIDEKTVTVSKFVRMIKEFAKNNKPKQPIVKDEY